MFFFNWHLTVPDLIILFVHNDQMYDRIARVEHVDHARRSAQHCIKGVLSAQTHTYVWFFLLNHAYEHSRNLELIIAIA